MNVLVLIGAYPSKKYPSNAIFTHCQVKELIKNGINVTVLEFDLRSIKNNRRIGIYRDYYEGVEVFRYALPIGVLAHYLPSSMVQKLCFKQYSRVVGKIGRPDVLHFHLMESANDYREIVKQCEEIPIVVTEHRCMWLEGCRVYKQRKGKIRKLYGAAKKVICVSKMQEKYISENYEAQTIVIPNYIDKKFDYNPTKKECRFTFISVGTFEYRKRFDLTIRAFSIFYEKHSASRLILVGAGALLEDMKTLVKKLEMDDEIVFMERIKNDLMPDIYNKSHVFVLPSMDESFGVVYAEAASCGLPIIATACGGPIDIVNDNNGLLIPINDLNALVDAMEQIYCNYHKYDSYEISKDIQNRFGSESVIARIIECYKV